MFNQSIIIDPPLHHTQQEVSTSIIVLLSRDVFCRMKAMLLTRWNRNKMADILCVRPANEGRRYTVTPSLVGWVHTHNDPWNGNFKCVFLNEEFSGKPLPEPLMKHLYKRHIASFSLKKNPGGGHSFSVRVSRDLPPFRPPFTLDPPFSPQLHPFVSVIVSWY